jgi:hypothetical protein
LLHKVTATAAAAVELKIVEEVLAPPSPILKKKKLRLTPVRARMIINITAFPDIHSNYDNYNNNSCISPC